MADPPAEGAVASHYCDIRYGRPAPCVEIDLFEGNRHAAQAALHTRVGVGVEGTCNADGCLGNVGRSEVTAGGERAAALYGPGAEVTMYV